jgi:hypothetical protein
MVQTPVENFRGAIFLMLSGAALLLPLSADAETFRCGKWLVTEELTLEELTQKCGTPTSRESKTEDIKARNRNNGLMIKTGETTTERWVYDRGTGAVPMVVIIVDGRIKSIERLEK